MHHALRECEAFISEYQYAVEQYKAICKRFGELPKTAALDPKLNRQIKEARLDCERYREALRIHQGSHRSHAKSAASVANSTKSHQNIEKGYSGIP